MRRDGRARDELRPVELTLDFTENPLSSVLCSMGRTRVLCTVAEEAGVPRWLKGSSESEKPFMSREVISGAGPMTSSMRSRRTTWRSFCAAAALPSSK